MPHAQSLKQLCSRCQEASFKSFPPMGAATSGLLSLGTSLSLFSVEGIPEFSKHGAILLCWNNEVRHTLHPHPIRPPRKFLSFRKRFLTTANLNAPQVRCLASSLLLCVFDYVAEGDTERHKQHEMRATARPGQRPRRLCVNMRSNHSPATAPPSSLDPGTLQASRDPLTLWCGSCPTQGLRRC